MSRTSKSTPRTSESRARAASIMPGERSIAVTCSQRWISWRVTRPLPQPISSADLAPAGTWASSGPR